MSSQAPKVEKKNGINSPERITHPSFGHISVSKVATNQKRLFGSPLHHNKVINVTLSDAYMDRNLNKDWIHSDRQILSFYLSEAQWAALISSQGGGGIPITFESKPSDDFNLVPCPEIEQIETMRQTHEREVKEQCEAYMADARALLDAITCAVSDGKAGKGKLEELRKMAEVLAVGLPNTMSFIQKQSEHAMEKTVEAGKIEIESFVNDLAARTGFEALREKSVGLIEQERSCAGAKTEETD